MNYKIRIKNANFSSEEFIQEWEQTSEGANAKLATPNSKVTLSATPKDASTIVVSIATGLASSAIYDLIKLVAEKISSGRDGNLEISVDDDLENPAE